MVELAAVNLSLRPLKTNAVPGWLGRATQAHFLRSLEQLNPELAAIVHDGSRARPFTASNLFTDQSTRQTLQLRPSQTVNLRYTTLHPHMTALLLNGLIPQWCVDGIVIHDQPLIVVTVHLQATDDPWTGHATYEELLTQADSRKRTIRLTFKAPTTFKKTGGRFVPLPLPELVFGSLLDRWNLFAPIKLPETLYDTIVEGVWIEDHCIQTHPVRLNGKMLSMKPSSGFVGPVTYRLDTLSPDESRGIHALAAFAKYSGVGVKTTMGMGQVRA